MLEQLGGRKFIATGLMTVIGMVVMFIKGDVPPNFLNLLEVAIAAFVGGNVLSSVAGVFHKSKQEAGEATDVTAEPEPGAPAGAEPQAAETTAQQPTPAQTPISNEQIYAGLSEVYQKLEQTLAAVNSLSETTSETAKAVNVSQKVLNILLERR